MSPADEAKESKKSGDSPSRRLRVVTVIATAVIGFFGGSLLVALPVFLLILLLGVEVETGAILFITVGAVGGAMYLARRPLTPSADSDARLGLALGFFGAIVASAYSWATWEVG